MNFSDNSKMQGSPNILISVNKRKCLQKKWYGLGRNEKIKFSNDKKILWFSMGTNRLGSNLHKSLGVDQNVSSAILPQKSDISLGNKNNLLC